MNISILGGGSWGTALAVHLSKKNHDIKVWEFFEEQAREMQESRHCKLLPQITLPENIFISSSLEKVLLESDLVLLVVPSNHVARTIESAVPYLSSQPIIICSKGLGENLEFLSEIVAGKVSGEVYCLYGPTHAEEVCMGIFSGIVLAGTGDKEKLKQVIESDTLLVELTDDIKGVQVSAALKNILAILVGVLDGSKYGDNTKAFVLTKGLEEIKEIGVALGGKEETFYGLAGMGDLIVTCGSQHSRNRHVGHQLGEGKLLPEVLTEMNMVAEGVDMVKAIPVIKEKTGLTIPLLTGAYDILYNAKNIKQILEEL